jgi:tripartite-type tricarboxylate transporter receptor subunit TctC
LAGYGLAGINQWGSSVITFKKILSPAAVILLALSIQPAPAQNLGRPIRIIVPFPAGGSADVIARLLAQQASQGGANIVVENRPGGGTVIATESVSRAAPDGTTLLLMGNSFVINASVRPNLSYNPLTSFEPICLLVSSPQILVVKASSPFRSLTDFVATAKAKPGELSYAAVGPATTQHIAMEQFKRLADIDVTYVPYTGGAPAINALLGGHVAAVLANFSEMTEQLAAGTLRALAVASRERFDALRDVPTFGEAGYKDFAATAWFGIVAPAKTAKETISQLSLMFTSALQAADVKSKFVAQGLYPIGECGASFGAHLKAQYEQYARIIRDANIKPE